LNVPGTADEAQAARLAAPRPASEGWMLNPVSAASSNLRVSAEMIDMKMVAARCRVKAEGCDWAARHRDQWTEVSELDHLMRKAQYDDIIARARALPNCYVFSLNPKLNVPGFETMSKLAAGYRNLAAAAELAELVHREGPHVGEWRAEIYALLAEAQSALRAAMDLENLYIDSDQDESFRWLRWRTTDDRVHLARYMKLEDPAELADHADLTTRLTDFRGRLTAQRDLASKRRDLLSKAKYHGRLLREAKSNDAPADWRKLMAALSSLVESGVQASDANIREVLVPIIEQLPDNFELPPRIANVMEALDQFLTTRELESVEDPRPRASSPELLEVAELLRDQVAVIIGGECRPRSKQALERDLGLAELRWISAAHHQSHYLFESAIARPETVIVMLAIRWSAHAFGNVDEFCRKHGKLFIRLPGGYNANQVAKQILEQVGRQLRELRSGVVS
jgi:hypothetical protein